MFAVRGGNRVIQLDFRGKPMEEFDLTKPNVVDILREKIGKHVVDLVLSTPNVVIDISKCEETDLMLV